MEDKELILKAEFNPRVKLYFTAYVALILFGTVIGIPIMIIWLLGVGQMVARRYYKNLRCELTTSHLQFKKGVFFKVEKTIPLENIQDLTFLENPILKYFGLRVLKIETAGHSNAQGADMKLVGIVDCEVFKQSVLEQRKAIQVQSKSQNSTGNNSDLVLSEIRDLLKSIDKKLDK